MYNNYFSKNLFYINFLIYSIFIHPNKQNTKMRLTRGHKSIIILLLFSIIWLILCNCNNIIELKGIHNIIKALPAYFIIIFGCYALFTIGGELAILKDYPEESKSLL